MAFLIREGEGSTATNPVLDLYTNVSGILTDAFSVRFKIHDLTTQAARDAFFGGDEDSSQVFPVTPGTYFNCDVTNLATDPVTPGHKLSTGHYYAPWDPADDAPLGTYLIKWQYQQTDGGPLRTYCEEFTVIQEGQIFSGTNKIEKLKLLMQDSVSKNNLCNEVEYSDQQYAMALELSLSKFNCMTPCTNYTLESFPAACDYILCLGAIGILMRSTSISQLRNQLTYTDGNIHVGITDKHRDYQNAAQTYLAEFEAMSRAKKNQMNNDSAWGESQSAYSSIGYGYGGYYGGGWGWGDA